ncbi:hypothetical protein [Vibrio sp. AND4]|uniref:hypothetical protein n=1 Tax=Vibrio sp. AND4 TaxID=314289 RepID=UPI00015F2BF9|nr:hypothetical protein [Vibrio sp. AND4]EDP57982.1 hypothetical protein AND4_05409 [Vibrio sp. AND4]
MTYSDTYQQSRFGNSIDPAALKLNFAAGKVPTQTDFHNLISLAGQVRSVDDSSFDLNSGQLSFNYESVSNELAGQGLTAYSNQLNVNYERVSNELAGQGLTAGSNQLDVNYNEITNNIADKVWKITLAKMYGATHYAGNAHIMIFFRSINGAGSGVFTRAYIHSLSTMYMGIYGTNVTLNGAEPNRTQFTFTTGDKQNNDSLVLAEWYNKVIVDSTTLKLKLVTPRYTTGSMYELPIKKVSELFS